MFVPNAFSSHSQPSLRLLAQSSGPTLAQSWLRTHASTRLTIRLMARTSPTATHGFRGAKTRAESCAAAGEVRKQNRQAATVRLPVSPPARLVDKPHVLDVEDERRVRGNGTVGRAT